MEEMTYVGYRYGTFTDERGAAHDYCGVYMIAPMEGEQSDTCHFAGQAAIKYRATAPEVFSKTTIGSRVRCYFDSKNRLAFMQAVSGGQAKIDPRTERGGGRQPAAHPRGLTGGCKIHGNPAERIVTQWL